MSKEDGSSAIFLSLVERGSGPLFKSSSVGQRLLVFLQHKF